MKLAVTLLLAILITGCTSTPAEDRCQQQPARLAELKSKVRDFLEVDLEESFVYYDDDRAVTSQIYQAEDGCRIYVFPYGEPDDGTTLLHGDGFVYFDPVTLEPSAFYLIGY